LTNGQLGLLAGYLGSLHDYFDECAFICNEPIIQPKPEGVEEDVVKPSVQGNDFTVVPNPMSDRFTLYLHPESVGKQVSIRILNRLGQVVFQQSLNELPDDRLPLNVANLQAGIYQIIERLGLIGLLNFQSLVNLSNVAGGCTKPGEARYINVFIASSSELREERRMIISLFRDINKF
jgi:hypothetical protein